MHSCKSRIVTLPKSFLQDYDENFASYKQQVESLTNQAEKLDQHKNLDARFKSSLEANQTYVIDLWKAVHRRAAELKDRLGKHMEEQKEFDQLAENIEKWMESLESHCGFAVPRSANIDQLKTQFEHVKVCSKMIKT